jgi:hypothetical protein
LQSAMLAMIQWYVNTLKSVNVAPKKPNNFSNEQYTFILKYPNRIFGNGELKLQACYAWKKITFAIQKKLQKMETALQKGKIGSE